jgi:antitoxin component of MazEF toxin-antitoxin module
MYARRIRLRKTGGSLCLTIPSDVIHCLGITNGSEFDVTFDREKMVVDLTTAEQSKVFEGPVPTYLGAKEGVAA